MPHGQSSLPSQVGGSDKREVWVNKRGAWGLMRWVGDDCGAPVPRRESVCVCLGARIYMCACGAVTTLT